VCDMVMPLMMSGDAALFPLIREILTRRATPDSQGWLAALQLWFFRSASEKRQEFPAGIDILSLIRAADFSVAPNRASQFRQRLEFDNSLRNAFVTRLLDALDGKLAWQLNSFLLSYLLKLAHPREMSARIPQIKAWLETHPEATDARSKYLSFLLQLPAELSDLRADAARRTAEWLEMRPDATNVRRSF
jgi:hypothetical protein